MNAAPPSGGADRPRRQVREGPGGSRCTRPPAGCWLNTSISARAIGPLVPCPRTCSSRAGATGWMLERFIGRSILRRHWRSRRQVDRRPCQGKCAATCSGWRGDDRPSTLGVTVSAAELDSLCLWLGRRTRYRVHVPAWFCGSPGLSRRLRVRSPQRKWRAGVPAFDYSALKVTFVCAYY
jgi:hypothetical protein